jgi:hypothetical protein
LEKSAYQEQNAQYGGYHPIAGLAPSDDGPEEEPGQGIEQDNLQVQAHRRVLREKHHGQHDAYGAGSYHEQHIPKDKGSAHLPFNEEYDESGGQ